MECPMLVASRNYHLASVNCELKECWSALSPSCITQVNTESWVSHSFPSPPVVQAASTNPSTTPTNTQTGTTSTPSLTAPASPSSSPNPSPNPAPTWAPGLAPGYVCDVILTTSGVLCGGKSTSCGTTGPCPGLCCAAGLTCTYANDYWSDCQVSNSDWLPRGHFIVSNYAAAGAAT